MAMGSQPKADELRWRCLYALGSALKGRVGSGLGLGSGMVGSGLQLSGKVRCDAIRLDMARAEKPVAFGAVV